MPKLSTTYAYQAITPIEVTLTTSYQDIATGGTNDSDVYVLTVHNTDSSTHQLTVAIKLSSTDIIIYTVTIDANTGNGTGVPVDLIKSEAIPGLTKDDRGNFYFRLKSGTKIRMKGSTNSDLIVTGYQMDF